jgi:hypothetical protein
MVLISMLLIHVLWNTQKVSENPSCNSKSGIPKRTYENYSRQKTITLLARIELIAPIDEFHLHSGVLINSEFNM